MRVLLVEDDLMIGEAVQEALKDASYAVDWVKDGHTALTTLSYQHYDLVLLDLGLPGKDGCRCSRPFVAAATPFLCSSSRPATALTIDCAVWTVERMTMC